MIKAEWTNKDTLDLQPTCNQLATDCISRQAAIDAVFGRSHEIIKMRIGNLPSAQQWIPCSERLPKARESVLITTSERYGYWVGEGCYWETTEYHTVWKGYRWNATYWDGEVVAWMPLPEPYKGVTE